MAYINADQISYSEDGNFSVGFFSLKHDGEEAIVRIMCDSMADLEIMTVHPITVGASSFPNRQVNCLRDPRDPLDMCPLCAAGEKIRQKVFIRMIQYDPTTKEAKAVVWDRVASVFAPRIKSFLENYGPLSHIMCKIIRHGTGKNTTYDIVPNLNPQEFNETNYPIPEDAFEDFSVLGRMVMDKNAEEIIEFMRTGAFPEKTPNQNQPPQNTAPSNYPQNNNYGNVAGNVYGAPPNNGYSAPTPNSGYSTPNQMPANQVQDPTVPPTGQGLERPTRYY